MSVSKTLNFLYFHRRRVAVTTVLVGTYFGTCYNARNWNNQILKIGIAGFNLALGLPIEAFNLRVLCAGRDPLVHLGIVHGGIVFVHRKDETNIVPSTQESKVTGEYGFELVWAVPCRELDH